MKGSDVVYVAEMESERFTWMGIGRTPEEAVAAIGKRWDRQQRDRGGNLFWDDTDTGESLPEYYGVNVRKMRIGEGYMETDEGE